MRIELWNYVRRRVGRRLGGQAAETKGGKVTPHFYASDEIWSGESFRVFWFVFLDFLFSFLGCVRLLY